MIYFHKCQAYIQSSIKAEAFEAIEKFIKLNKNRESLKGVGKVTAFTKGIYVLLIKRPYVEAILEERREIFNDKKILVYFIRNIKKSKNDLDDYVSIRDGKWLLSNPLPEYDLDAFKDSIKNELIKRTKKKILPPSSLVNWQSDYSLRVNYDIFEQDSWVKFSMSDSKSEGMKISDARIYLLAVKDILEEKSNIETIKNEVNYTLNKIESNDIGVIYFNVEIENKNYYILINGANLETQKEHWEKICSKEYNFEFKNYKDICRNSLRAYPKWVLNEPELWIKIEKNNELGNLSLLPEQTEFLKDFKFPKYINGQAGSGKSTMLYYLFANAYYYKYLEEIQGNIVFLTENEKLLDHTKKSVKDLLLHNPEFEVSSDPKAILSVDDCFHPFKEFLLKMIPNDLEKFKKNNYLDFSKFKKLYEKSNIQDYVKKRYSPELIWFIITTYVKGNNLDFRITSRNYDEKMPKEGKELISKDDLKNIEETIIKTFYDKLINEDSYWDKIELIKYITNNVSIEKRYEVIFCDEAQDFSKVELEFIMKLSSYTQYDLSNVSQFPIVFAGDALQTVNPTGFKSSVLTAMIYKELTNPDIGYNLIPDDLEFTPQYNYRSSQSIVNIANAIQNYRRDCLSAEVKFPQVSKRPVINKNEHLNVFVDLNVFEEDKKLQEKVEYKTIIVPVNRDEIEEYTDTFSILKKFDNIISAVDAKGLDFSEVVVFGFGEYAKQINKEKIYENRFFYNKLYVAVTRAQAELVIIDSEWAKDNFWKVTVENYLKSKWSAEVVGNLKGEAFDKLIVFNTNEIIQSSNYVLETDAKRQKEQGIIEENTALLKVASSHYIKLDNVDEYLSCLGEIEIIKENWKEAANFFKQTDNGIKKALQCYWLGELWQDYLNSSIKVVNEEVKIKRIIAKMFLDDNLSHSDISTLYHGCDMVKRELLKVNWRPKAINIFKYILESNYDKDEIVLICDFLKEILTNYDIDTIKIIAEKYSSVKKYKAAVDLLDSNGLRNTSFYIQLRLDWAKQRGNLNEIIVFSGKLIFEKNSNSKLIVKELVELFYENSDEIELEKETYVTLYLFISFLIKDKDNDGDDDDDDIQVLASIAESQFSNNVGRQELAEKYFELLNKNLVNEKFFNFVLERWVKNAFLSKALTLKEINYKYKNLIKDNQNYVKFTLEEIEALDEIPNKIKNEVPEHINNIKIRNFRKFKNLEISNLGLFNLVVGDNNIGKTSLLEALLFTPDKNEYLKRLALAYIDRSNLHPEQYSFSDITSEFYKIQPSFLSQYKNYNSLDNIIFEIYKKRENWSFEFKNFYSENINEKSYFSRKTIKLLENIPYDDTIQLPYIPFGKGYGQDLASIYDNLIRPNQKLQSEFIENLKVFIPNVKDVFVSVRNNSTTIDVRDSNNQEDVPLSQYGEGANKLFRILILLVLHKGKRLLIDEIDAGIHFSRFKQFWRIILKIAFKDKTQLIVTTHNEECISFFNEVLRESEFGENFQKVSRVVQMKKIRNIKIRSLEYDSFNLAYEDGIELRGGNINE